MSAPKPQRFGSVPLSQTIEQHPFCGPALHVSPVPRHSVFAGSSSHVSTLQMFEQHWELVVHGSLCTAQIGPPHVPLLQLRSQQSIAFTHAAPLPAHAFAHCVTPVIPCTGSQRELQQSLVVPAVHEAPGARQLPAGRHTLPWHRPEQQASAGPHAVPSAVQTTPSPFTSASGSVPEVDELPQPTAMASASRWRLITPSWRKRRSSASLEPIGSYGTVKASLVRRA